jgi:hypothetical protein
MEPGAKSGEFGVDHLTEAKEKKMQSGILKRLPGRELVLVLVLLVAGTLCACASTPWSSESSSTTGTAGSGSRMRPMSYDFPDVLLPSELELVPKDSYVFQGPKTKAGMLVFKGRVEAKSAIDFFQMSMPREGWVFKGGFRYKKSVLVFEKPEKMCLINVSESLYYTYVEVYVTPMEQKV